MIHIIYRFRKTETEYLSPVKWCIHVQITQSVEIMTSDCSLRYVPQVQKDIKIHIADYDYASMQGKKKSTDLYKAKTTSGKVMSYLHKAYPEHLK